MTRQMTGLKRAGHIARNLPSWLAATTLFVLMVMTFADVLLRSAFNAPLAAGPELTEMFVAIIVFSALPMVTWRGESIVVDLFDPMFSQTAGRIRDIVIDLLGGVLLFWPALRTWDLVSRTYSYGYTTEYLHIPEFYLVAFISVCTLATALVMVLRALAGVFKPSLLATGN